LRTVPDLCTAGWHYFDNVVDSVQPDRPPQIAGRPRVCLEGVHHSLLADEFRGEARVVPHVGADIKEDAAGSQQPPEQFGL
jgi:hypothetical protein